MEDEAFIRAIRDEPSNEAIRLVYADWLDERNDPRGEFLRICDRLQSKGTVSRRPDLETIQRLDELWAVIDPDWAASVGMPPGPWDALDRLEAKCSDPTFPGRWSNFVLACAESILPGLPAETRDWVEAAAQFDRGERLATELKELYETAEVLDRSRDNSDPWPIRYGQIVALTALGVRFAGFDTSRWHEGAWHFLNCCEAAGLSHSLLFALLQRHFGHR